MRLNLWGRWAGVMVALGVAWLVAAGMAWPGAARQADPELRAMCERAERIVHGVVEESVSAADPPGEGILVRNVPAFRRTCPSGSSPPKPGGPRTITLSRA